MISLFKKPKLLVTHNGTFHADDVFATAVLSILYKGNVKVFRTRDTEIIKKGDIVYDVGGEYIEEKDRFDHHQIGGAGKRANGIPYAAFGLVWKKYGSQVCGDAVVAEKIDQKLVQPIDANDNGMDLFTETGTVIPYTFQSVVFAFRPSFQEGDTYDAAFMELVSFAKKILEREIIKVRAMLVAETYIEKAYQSSTDKRLIILDEKYPWEEIATKYADSLFVIAPRIDGKWKVEGIFVKAGSLERRRYLPEAWAGLRDEALQKATGVPDAVFCHNGLFMAVAESKEGIIKLAQLALKA